MYFKIGKPHTVGNTTHKTYRTHNEPRVLLAIDITEKILL